VAMRGVHPSVVKSSGRTIGRPRGHDKSVL
jgi:hypothetical protein